MLKLKNFLKKFSKSVINAVDFSKNLFLYVKIILLKIDFNHKMCISTLFFDLIRVSIFIDFDIFLLILALSVRKNGYLFL